MDVPYSQLTHRGQVRRMTVLADEALRAYDLPANTRRTLLRHIYNTLFRVVTPDGERYVLRILHPRQASLPAVRSEAAWLTALRREGLRVPEPVTNREGETVFRVAAPGVPEPRLCVLSRWLEGRFVRGNHQPGHLAKVGGLMARLHNQAAQWERPDWFTRHRVDNLNPLRLDRDDNFEEAVAAEAVRLVTEVGTAEQGAVIANTIQRVWAVLRDLRGETGGDSLIHADLHQWNYLFSGGEVAAIDFDDCGFGPWLYDFAVTLSTLRDRANYAVLRAALLAGYRQVRTLTAEREAEIDTLIALRDLQDLLYDIQERDQPAFRDEWQATMTTRLRLLEAFLRG